MFIEPTITWVPSGFSGYIWLDTKIVLKNEYIFTCDKTNIDSSCLQFHSFSTYFLFDMQEPHVLCATSNGMKLIIYTVHQKQFITTRSLQPFM